MTEPSAPFDQLIRQGQDCLDRSDLDGAARQFRAACELRPDADNLDALIGLGHVLRQQGDRRGALGYLQKAAEVAPKRLRLRCEVGTLLRELGERPAARATFEAVLEADPDHVDALAGLGQTLRVQGDRRGALRYLRKAAELVPERLRLRCEIGNLLRELDQPQEARATFESVLRLDPENVDALVGLGHTLRKQGDYAAALPCLEEAAALDPRRLMVRCDVGGVLRELSRYDEALRVYDAVLVSDPGCAEALLGKSLVERSRGNNEASLELAAAASAIRPSHAPTQLELARAYRLAGRTGEAARTFTGVLDADPRSSPALRGLAQLALERGDIDAGVRYAEEAVAIEPQLADNRLALATAYRDAGRLEEALTITDAVLGSVPRNVGAMIEKALTLRALDRGKEALEVLEGAARQNWGRASFELASAQVALGAPDDARRTYAAILEKAPDNFWALLGIANLQMISGEHERCIETCDRLIAIYPRRLVAYRQKCMALIQLDRAAEAVQLVSTLDVDDSQLLDLDLLQLEMYRTCGLREEAEAVLARQRLRDSALFAVWHQVVLTRLAFYDIAGTEEALRGAPPHRYQDHSRVISGLAQLADLRWQVQEAIDLFQRALQVRPHDAAAHDHLARLYIIKADAAQASSHRQLAIEQAASAFVLRGQSMNVSRSLSGQLINELMLEPAQAQTLAASFPLPAAQRIDVLLGMQGRGDGLVHPALQLMVALRQAGALDALPDESAAADPGSAPIPRSIVQFWDREEAPESVANLMRGWADMHPDYRYQRFHYQSAREFLANHHSPEVQYAYQRATHPAQASDIFRLAYLYTEGGFYIDADDRCVGFLSTLPAAGIQFIAYHEQFGTIGNNFIASAPGDPVVGRALTLVVEAMTRGDNDSIWLATGPGLLTRAFAAVLAEQGADWPMWLRQRRILSRGDLALVSWGHSILHYKNTRQSWSRQEFKGAIDRRR